MSIRSVYTNLLFIFGILLVKFAFRESLTSFVSLWNHHKIRPSSNEMLVSGKPSFLFECPEIFGEKDQKVPVTTDKSAACRDFGVSKSLREEPCNKDMFELCIHLMAEHGLNAPSNAAEALCLHLKIRPLARSLIGCDQP